MELLPYQQDAVNKMCSQSVTLLADEPGLGKTVQAIGLINKTNADTALIVVPASLKLNWLYELKTWLTRDLTIHIVKNGKDLALDADIIIINYELVIKPEIIKKLKSRKFDIAICDEAHYLKNHLSKRSQALLGFKSVTGGVLHTVKRNLLMTGTPIINSPCDIWPIANKLFKNIIAPYSTYFDFSARYSSAYVDAFNNWALGYPRNLDELREKLQPVMIRRLKTDVLKDLPDKRYQMVHLEPDRAMRSLVKQEHALLANFKGTKLASICEFSEMATLRRESGMAKLKSCAAHIIQSLESGVESMVVFLHHRETIIALSEMLQAYSPRMIKGDTPLAERDKIVQDFQKGEKTRILICNIKSGGVGLTLTRASHVVFVEMPWTAAEVHQAIDRCHRIGQKDSVLAQFLIIENSIDAFILNKILEKELMVTQLIRRTTTMNTPTIKQNLEKIKLIVADMELMLAEQVDTKHASNDTTHAISEAIPERIDVVTMLTHADLKDRLKRVIRIVGRETAVEILKAFNGAKQVTDIVESDFEQFVETCDQACACDERAA